MNLWDYLRETPDERRRRKMREAKRPKRKPAPTAHPDDHYPFSGLDAYAAKKRTGKH